MFVLANRDTRIEGKRRTTGGPVARRVFLLAVALVAPILLSACGGGSSDSGTGGPPVPGTYRTVLEWTLKTRTSETLYRDPVLVTVQDDNIDIQIGTGTFLSGKLVGNSFDLSTPNIWRPGIYVCNGTVNMSGTVTDVVNGRYIFDSTCRAPNVQDERITASTPWRAL